MSDQDQLESLLNPQDGEDQLFNKLQLESINQLGATTIAGQQKNILFSFQDVKDCFISFKDAWIEIPVTVTSFVDATTPANSRPFSAAPLLAAKASLLSLLNSVRVTTVGNSSLLDTEANLHLSANLRLLLENNPEFLETVASQIHYSKDYPHLSSVGMKGEALLTGARTDEFEEKKTPAFAAGAAVTAADVTTSRTADYNAGFMERRSALLADVDNDSTQPLTSSIIFRAKIPLKYIHDFFAQLDFPIYYPNIKIDFYFNVKDMGSYLPFSYGRKNAATYESDAANYTVTLTAGQEPKLYYHRVVMPPEVAAQVAKKFESGFSRTIRYRRYDVRDPIAIAANTAFDQDISTDSVATRRIFGLLQPTVSNSADGVKWPSPLLTVGALEDANVKVHKINQFDNNIVGNAERWSYLKSEFPYMGVDNGPLDYKEFTSRYNILCMNVSRKGELLNKDSSTVIRPRCRPTAAGQIRWIIEEERICQVEFGAKGITRVIDASAVKV